MKNKFVTKLGIGSIRLLQFLIFGVIAYMITIGISVGLLPYLSAVLITSMKIPLEANLIDMFALYVFPMFFMSAIIFTAFIFALRAFWKNERRNNLCYMK